jgi:hypothetical protein
MIKLKDLLLEGTAPDIFVPRRMEDRLERMISLYIRNGSKGDISLSGLNLTVLPDILKNISVVGSFYCGHNKLTSLQGAPSSVDGDFYCRDNKLTTLEGAPKTVGRHFSCSYNNLTSLEGAPKTVGGNFGCSGNNKLTTLTGAPSSVGGDFICVGNPVKFTEKQVRAVCDVKGDVFV